jgi:hypothetical protein
MATKPQESDTDNEIAQRLDRALQRAFKMPHKPHEPMRKKAEQKPRKKGKR